MAVTWPAYGTEKYVLRERGKGFKLVRAIYTDTGVATQFDHDDLDFKSRPGSWVDVETLGTFATKDEARAFMIARQETPRVPCPKCPGDGIEPDPNPDDFDDRCGERDGVGTIAARVGVEGDHAR